MKAKYPDLSTPFLVGCATGKKYSINALMALDEAGYENLAGLKGGYNAWIRLWDNNFRRRGEWCCPVFSMESRFRCPAVID